MTVQRCLRGRVSARRLVFFRASAAIAVAAGVCCATATRADAPREERGILRFDPVQERLIPVEEWDAKPGCVYSHFSARLNRRVWAIRLADGRFSHALGEGSTQSGPAFDMRESIAAKVAKLERTNRELLRRLEREGGVVFLRLRSDERWELDPHARHATIYDVETKYRWESVYSQYVPVSSAPFAYRWQIVNGEYVPLKD